MRNEREYWERKLKLLEKQEEEFRKREEKENSEKRQEETRDRASQTMAIVGVIGGVLLYAFLWALFADVALAAFFWLLFFAVFGWFKG